MSTATVNVTQPSRVAELATPALRAARATDALTELARLTTEWSTLRAAAVREMRDSGMTLAAIGETMGGLGLSQVSRILAKADDADDE